MRKNISWLLKCLTVATSLGGVAISLINARRDGYSHWSRRLLYFTAQSNLWIGFTFLAILLLPLIHKKRKNIWKKRLYLLKYVFTVSITMTGLVFCFLLAPFADESYHAWSVSGFLTHVFTPILAIADFFVDEYRIPLRGKHVLFTALPPILYFSTASVLEGFNTDFGRGVPYPYFFLNYRSPAGMFGFSKEFPFFIGTFYWMTLFGLIMLAIGAFYARVYSPRLRH